MCRRSCGRLPSPVVDQRTARRQFCACRYPPSGAGNSSWSGWRPCAHDSHDRPHEVGQRHETRPAALGRRALDHRAGPTGLRHRSLHQQRGIRHRHHVPHPQPPQLTEAHARQPQHEGDIGVPSCQRALCLDHPEQLAPAGTDRSPPPSPFASPGVAAAHRRPARWQVDEFGPRTGTVRGESSSPEPLSAPSATPPGPSRTARPALPNTDEIGSRPNAGRMCTFRALTSDSQARTETWPRRASRNSSASSRTVIRPAPGATNSPEISSRFCSVSHRTASPLRSKVRSATVTPLYFTLTRHVPYGVL